jgi:NAD(P)-dependent dehydrogenase (short-subunit alcohol dehydrogenase family)
MSTKQASNPIAVITGGSRGLGKSMALHLADRGVDSVITYRSGEKEARDVVMQIEAKGKKALSLFLDVANAQSFGAFAETLQRELGRVWDRRRFDYLINNAGTGLHASFAETTEDQFDEMVNIHLKAPYFLTQKVLPLIADGGRIINISTGLTRFTFPGTSAYAAVKGGVEVLTRYMAKELGARGISVNTIAPGAIATDFSGGMVRDNPEINARVAGMTALGRVGLPNDVGGAVAMLVAPDNRWITGQRIEVSGGQML